MKKKDQKGATEKTKTDLKRARREKKKKQKEKHLRREKKDKEIEKLGLSTKYAKDKAKRELGKQSQSSKGVTVLKVRNRLDAYLVWLFKLSDVHFILEK